MSADGLLSPQSGDLPHVNPSALTSPFWEGCAEGELRYQRCDNCGSANFPPQEHCRRCSSFDQQWKRSTGCGRLYSWTIVRRPVTAAFHAPYAPAIITLDEGYQMITNMVGMAAESLRIDLAVRVVFHHVDGHGLWLPYFTEAR